MYNKSKRILITTYFFYPQNTPRAFRAWELAKGFSTKGYEVDVYIPNNDFDYSEIEKHYNINIIKIGKYLEHNQSRIVNNKQSYFKNKIGNLLRYLIVGKSLVFANTLSNALKNININYDLIISIGLPISIHIGTYRGLKFNSKNAIKIADYGDPFYYSPIIKVAPYFKYIERKVLKFFNYITIPVESSIEYYKKFDIEQKIRVIPQGYDFKDIKLEKYTKNNVPTFAYAGIFYPKVRDPREFFEKLIKIDTNFKMYIYTDTKLSSSMELIEKYIKILGNKVEVVDLLPRIECIKELSKMDFIINIDNIKTGQVPSKLIDYTLCKRPILNVIPNDVDEEEIKAFLNGNYEKQLKIDISRYNIEYTIKEIEKLMVKK